MDEALGVCRVGGVEHALAGIEYGAGAAEVDVGRREESERLVMVLVVIPLEEGTVVRDGRADVVETAREVGTVLERLELRLGERVVVGDVRPRVALRHAQVGEELRERLGAHRCTAILVQRERTGLDAVLRAGFGDEPPRVRRVLALGDHPADDVPAEDVEHDVGRSTSTSQGRAAS